MSADNPGKALHEMATGFFRSRVLCTAARLGIADVMDTGERTVAELAAASQSDASSLYRLLRALATFGIVQETDPATFALTPLGLPLRRTLRIRLGPASYFGPTFSPTIGPT